MDFVCIVAHTARLGYSLMPVTEAKTIGGGMAGIAEDFTACRAVAFVTRRLL